MPIDMGHPVRVRVSIYKSGAENKFGKKIEERSNLLRGCLIRGPTAPQITFFSVRRAFV